MNNLHDSNGIGISKPILVSMTMALAFSSNAIGTENHCLDTSSFISLNKIYNKLPREFFNSKDGINSQAALYEFPLKKSYKERYKKIVKSMQFSSAYHGMSVGDLAKIDY